MIDYNDEKSKSWSSEKKKKRRRRRNKKIKT